MQRKPNPGESDSSKALGLTLIVLGSAVVAAVITAAAVVTSPEVARLLGF